MTYRLSVSGTPVRIDFDPDEVRARFAKERDRRIKREGVDQFQGLSDVLEHEDVDRYAQPITREAVFEETDVVLLGGGLGGLCTGAYLRKHGVTDFRIIEQGGDFGGTWYWNRYPGVQVDMESLMYMPFLEETGYIPTQRYADGAELYEHTQRLGKHFDLYRSALFQTIVTSVTWDNDQRRWEVRTDRGDVIRARFVVRSNGVLSKPQIPRVPGINDFKGKIFHTSRWDYDYTGGDQRGNLSKLKDKRVAVVGTGATAIQVVPFLAKDAGELLVVQRTPSTVGVRNNVPIDPNSVATLEPGWQAARIRNFNEIMNEHDPAENVVNDTWTQVFGKFDGRDLVDVDHKTLPLEDQLELRGLADLYFTLQIHKRIDSIITDPETAEALKPWYGYVCKRPGLNDEYYPAFNQPNVRLVPSPDGVDGITETGLVVDGKAYDVDLIVFSTGFETNGSTRSRYGYEVTGRSGLTMSDYFSDGAKTLHGLYTRNFPNFIELGLSQNAYIVNFGFMLERKANHAARVIAHAMNHGIDIEPTQEAQEEWVTKVREAAKPALSYMAECTPGYYNGQGDISKASFREVYKISEVDFWDQMDAWWEEGALDGLDVAPAHAAQPTTGSH
ncbi:NAD(P)/FAD-dependent oxidoreductase [Rhodococcus sp. T2V]|uniref:flavin-containing monooxygenase n=1 Tax=Rhodococcus sp. T2V TaxID=3034164 RepID=UPI0023E1794F|nr:NAD(P)/FAD-dependent oxidoreductase [Rhodococcus sp. T2V]MDF3310577.1 NAD(P)/FAD-dependent oxidoreductase [Rhodococcus sp. T2V]